MDGTRVPAHSTAPLPAGDCPPILIVSTYFKGATVGKGLGTAGYSYEFVRQLFLPIMKHWGEVVFVRDAAKEVEPAGRKAEAEGKRPIHIGFVACQDLYISPTMPNVVVPAWEFPDVPDVEFEDNPQNDWVATANRCDMVWAHVPFTADALVRAGVTAPIREVPVPMPPEYFAVPPRRGTEPRTIDAPCYVFNGLEAPAKVGRSIAPPPPPSLKQKLKGAIQPVLSGVKATARFLTPEFVWRTLQNFKREYRTTKAIHNIEHPVSPSLTLSGYVYTSIFNPGDGRKNFKDLLTGFVAAMRDCEDATLVLKLVTRDPQMFYDVYDNYRRIAMPHKCKVVLIREYLSDRQMMALLDASTYYVTTTKAEGNCLPLMNYLAAGRPGITPAHSAIGDYFDDGVGFVVDSHPEPAMWPQEELRPHYRTTWARMVWPSFVEQLKRSYHVAKHDRRRYERLSEAARSRMQAWLHEDAVYPLMAGALDAVLQRSGTAGGSPVRRAA